jgi:hypothetical protein
MSFTDVVIFNFIFLLCFIIQCIVVIIHWNGRTSTSRKNFAIKPHKIKQLQISAKMKLGNKSELIEHIFRKQETHLAYISKKKKKFEKKNLKKITNYLGMFCIFEFMFCRFKFMFCRFKFFLSKLTVYQSESSKVKGLTYTGTEAFYRP